MNVPSNLGLFFLYGDASVANAWFNAVLVLLVMVVVRVERAECIY